MMTTAIAKIFGTSEQMHIFLGPSSYGRKKAQYVIDLIVADWNEFVK